MKNWMRTHEGQALIQVALAIVVLLAFLGLAIDVGHIYSERRHMQNAADAGALAGARELCYGNNHTAAKNAAVDYAINRNGAHSADVAFEGANNLTVSVVANTDANTFFAPIFGINSISVSAEAAAACGPPDTACGTWPVAFKENEWLSNTSPCSNDTKFVLFDGNVELDCSVDDCDIDDDGEDDVILGSQHRAWMDFTTAITDDRYEDDCTDNDNGCGLSELECRIIGNHNPPLNIPGCVGGDPGSRDSLFTKNVPGIGASPLESRIGDVVKIPLYDSVGCPGSPPGSCSDLYHVTRLVCVRVTDVQHQYPVNGDPTNKQNLIIVQPLCEGCPSDCGTTTGGGLSPGEVGTVSLVR